MSLRLRRGTNAERATRVFDLAEPVWVTDKQQLWIGNGTGSVDPIASYAGTGLSYSYNSTNGGRLSVNLGALNTDQLPQGGTNKYFSNQQAQDAFAELLSNGTQTGVSFTYDPISHALDASLDISAFLVATDTDPSLGGDLDLNSSDITGTGNIDINGNLQSTGVNGTVTILGNEIETDSPSLDVGVGNNIQGLRLTSLVDEIDGPIFQFKALRGTASAPELVNIGDYIGQIRFQSRVIVPGGNASYPDLVVIQSIFDEASDGISTFPRGKLRVLVSNGPNQSIAAKLEFDKDGLLSVPRVSVSDGTAANPSIAFTTDGGVDTGLFHPGDGILCISTNATERVRVDTGGMRVVGFMKVGGYATGSLPAPAEAGMIVLDTDTNQFKGYNGSAWVVLG